MKKAFCQQTDSLLALSRSNSHKCTKLRTIFLEKVFPKAFLFSTSNKPHPAFKSCWCLVQRLIFYLLRTTTTIWIVANGKISI